MHIGQVWWWLRVAVSASILCPVHGEVEVWEDHPWTLFREDEVVSTIDDGGGVSLSFPSAVAQKSGHHWMFFRESPNFYGQRFNTTNDSLVGPRVRMNQNSGTFEKFIDVVRLNSFDGFVYGWYITGVDADSAAAMMRIFHSNGSAVTDDIIVNEREDNAQYLTDLSTIDGSAIPNGERIIAAYADLVVATYQSYVRMFEVNGTAVMNIRLDPDYTSWVWEPRVTGLSDGKFVAAWVNRNESLYSRRAQIFNSDGSVFTESQTVCVTISRLPLGFSNEFGIFDWQSQLFGSLTGSEPESYHLLTLKDDIFVLVGRHDILNGTDITASIYDGNLNRCGNEFIVHDTPDGDQTESYPFLIQVSDESDVIFGVSWLLDANQGYSSIFGLEIPSNGECTQSDQAFKIGSDYPVWPQEPSEVNEPRSGIALDDQGGFLIPFQGFGLSTTDYLGVGAQKYKLFRVNNAPTLATTQPTANPTVNPSQPPTSSPTLSTMNPTEMPSEQPSDSPSTDPSQHPSVNPTLTPSLSTLVPTNDPTNHPSWNPSTEPSKSPTPDPTANPTAFPSQSPSHATQGPSESPTQYPSEYPSKYPSEQTILPTMHPANDHPPQPTLAPSMFPSAVPTLAPIASHPPSSVPTINPSSEIPPFDNPSEEGLLGLNSLASLLFLATVVCLCCFAWICFTALGIRYISIRTSTENSLNQIRATVKRMNDETHPSHIEHKSQVNAEYEPGEMDEPAPNQLPPAPLLDLNRITSQSSRNQSHSQSEVSNQIEGWKETEAEDWSEQSSEEPTEGSLVTSRETV